MPAILHPAARQMAADTAGLTHVTEGPPAGAPAAISPSEIVAQLPADAGELSHLFSGTIPQYVSTEIVQPTKSTIGRLGGLVPTLTTPQQPGPPPAVSGTTFPGEINLPNQPATPAPIGEGGAGYLSGQLFRSGQVGPWLAGVVGKIRQTFGL
jgi:hypothetical protein